MVAAAIAGGLGFWGWPVPQRAFEFAGLMLAAILAVAFTVRPVATSDWTLASAAIVVVADAIRVR